MKTHAAFPAHVLLVFILCLKYCVRCVNRIFIFIIIWLFCSRMCDTFALGSYRISPPCFLAEFLSIVGVIGCEYGLKNYLNRVGWGIVKLGLTHWVSLCRVFACVRRQGTCSLDTAVTWPMSSSFTTTVAFCLPVERTRQFSSGRSLTRLRSVQEASEKHLASMSWWCFACTTRSAELGMFRTSCSTQWIIIVLTKWRRFVTNHSVFLRIIVNMLICDEHLTVKVRAVFSCVCNNEIRS